MFLNHSIKLNFLLKSYLWPEIQHKYIKAKEGEKVQKCRSGIQIALTTLPVPTELRGQSVLLPTEQLLKGGWLYRKRLKVKTASSNGWGIKINQVHGGITGARCVALSIAAKIYGLETALVTQPKTVPGKSIPGTGEFTLLSTIWSC